MRVLIAVVFLALLAPPAAAADVAFEWSGAPALPAGRSNAAVVAWRGHLYAVGGNDAAGPTGTFQAYDPETRAWEALPPMRTSRYAHGAAVLGGRLYAFGGLGPAGPLDSVEVYDFASRTWADGGRLPSPRARFGLATLDGRVYLVGGLEGSDTATARVDSWLPGAAWESRAALPLAVHRLEAAALGNGILAAGGQDARGQGLARAFQYDPAADRWSEVAPMARARRNFALVRLGPRLVAAGGWDEGPAGRLFLREAEAWDGASWTSLPALPAARDGVKGAALGGSVYLVGGYDGAVQGRVDRGLWRVKETRWRLDEGLRAHLATLGEPANPGSAVPSLGFAPEAEPDITNIRLQGLRDLGFPVPPDPRTAEKSFYLKFYALPSGTDPGLSARRAFGPLLALQVGRALEEFLRTPGALVVKKGVIDLTARRFDAAHPYPPLREQPQGDLDGSVAFSSIYVLPVPGSPARTLKGTAAAGSADGVLAFQEELLALYRQTFGEPAETGRGWEFWDDSDPGRTLRLRVPREPIVLAGWADAPMPQDPKRVFLTGLLLVYEDLEEDGRPVRSRVFEVGSVVRLP